jgi:tetratricopeptide (TPR) repeat protein
VKRNARTVLIAGSLGLLALLALVAEGGQRNLTFLALSRALLAPGTPGVGALPGATLGDPADLFARGLLAAQAGDATTAGRDWAAAVQADEGYVGRVRDHAPTDAALATLAATRYPDDAEAAEWLGDALTATQPAAALTAYQRAVARQPDASLVWEKMGTLAAAQGQADLARTADRHACDLNPNRNGTCISAAHFAYVAGAWAECIQYYERAQYPEYSAQWVELIRAAQALGRPADAEHYLTLAQRRDPADYMHLLQTPTP